MFQFTGFPSVHYPGMCPVHARMHGVFPCGFPHSDTCGSQGMCPSPQLFAAYHVFLRLLVPRHPPCALFAWPVSSLPCFKFRNKYFSNCPDTLSVNRSLYHNYIGKIVFVCYILGCLDYLSSIFYAFVVIKNGC